MLPGKKVTIMYMMYVYTRQRDATIECTDLVESTSRSVYMYTYHWDVVSQLRLIVE